MREPSGVMEAALLVLGVENMFRICGGWEEPGSPVGPILPHKAVTINHRRINNINKQSCHTKQ
jgi:hypothetical protein